MMVDKYGVLRMRGTACGSKRRASILCEYDDVIGLQEGLTELASVALENT